MTLEATPSIGEVTETSVGVAFSSDVLFEVEVVMCALIAAGLPPVFIRACEVLRLVRTGPLVCAFVDEGSGVAGATDGLEGGGVSAVAVMGFSV